MEKSKMFVVVRKDYSSYMGISTMSIVGTTFSKLDAEFRAFQLNHENNHAAHGYSFWSVHSIEEVNFLDITNENSKELQGAGDHREDQ